MKYFDWPIRVYYEDTDSGGVVYHANYIKFMERARTEWLRRLGFEQNQLRSTQSILFAVHSMQLNFRKPARFNDQLLVRSSLKKVSGASIKFEQQVLLDATLLCEATVKVACLNEETFQPCPIPNFILTEMQREC
ncbi:tol-pal system-associated acyl-CoA thioesterase [Methylophaga sp. OBS3]|jgi:acyl-CoA thioester hydrolase|uniref:tol-pal system-associated acyl-CoA thioesterase n=1 Tax=Methylophaga sp. OBS3 TaxID=2991934 RepID=UPI00224C8B3C|nr:tol-pal system-associated acyl-CoA thioesterase [Methylophaga sp. OBS3]MCX4189966.1 tol-pal system-associated acyl-CoA thioesterase [Methylophaga sp. OBS3]